MFVRLSGMVQEEENLRKSQLMNLFTSACNMFNAAKKIDLRMVSIFPVELCQIVEAYLNWTKTEFSEILFQPVNKHDDEWLDLYIIVHLKGNIYLLKKCPQDLFTREIIADLNFLACIPPNKKQTCSTLLPTLSDILVLKFQRFTARTGIPVL